jgi:hypothetical protein
MTPPMRHALGDGGLDVVLGELVARQRHREPQADGRERRAHHERWDQERAQTALRDDGDHEDRDRAEDQPTEGEAEQAGNLGAAA